jgi:hypothetical protein
VTPAERAALVRRHGIAYVERIDRDMGIVDAPSSIDAPRAADLGVIEDRARTLRGMGMAALATELDAVVDELHYLRARAAR